MEGIWRQDQHGSTTEAGPGGCSWEQREGRVRRASPSRPLALGPQQHQPCSPKLPHPPPPAPGPSKTPWTNWQTFAPRPRLQVLGGLLFKARTPGSGKGTHSPNRARVYVSLRHGLEEGLAHGVSPEARATPFDCPRLPDTPQMWMSLACTWRKDSGPCRTETEPGQGRCRPDPMPIPCRHRKHHIGLWPKLASPAQGSSFGCWAGWRKGGESSIRGGVGMLGRVWG